ncbi:unnamed protein product [Durusdinium trenchii]|uniref:Uncharacterized protein n=2 Tax=Durusdinium trenchii TaxID=1381693 RepID=A0ABP0SG60_9DINO
MSKGGARRFSVPPVDMDALQGIIDRAVESKGAAAFLLGEYDAKKVTTAVSAAGLHQNAAWVKDFFNISKGEILAGQLKQCIQKYGHSHNTSDWKDDLWAGKIASQMVCILSHVRRLGREPDKLRQCLQGATGAQRHTIEELVALYACKKANEPPQPSPDACKKAQEPSQDACKKANEPPQPSPDACKKAQEPSQDACKKANSSSSVGLPLRKSHTESAPGSEQACKKARTLKEEISMVSVDSHGFPMILKSPEHEDRERPMSILERQRASYREQLQQAAQAAAQQHVADGSSRPEETGGQMVAKVLLKKARGLQEGQSGTLFGKKGEAKGPERLAEERAAFLELQQKLKFHEETQKAIQGLKEGQLSEDEFWNKLCKNERTALWKKFECERNKSPEARKAWLEMEGKGVMEKKKQLLLHFIKTGQKSAGGLKQSQEASQSKQENELFEWVPWKQVQDWYGKDEALARVEQGLLPVRKVGRKFFEFLLVKQQTTLSLEQKKRLAAEQEMALKGPELLACKKALAAGRTEKEWEALWSERRPEKSFQLEDALSESSSDTSPGEEVATEEEADAALTFLRGLRKGQSEAETNKDKKKTKEEKKAEQESKKQQLKAAKEEKQKKLEAEKLAKQKAAAEKWSKKLEEATQVGEDEKETKVKKMLSIVSKEVADLKKACKKASSSDWGKHELANLSKCRDELEDLQMDCLESVKEKLLQSAAALKASKKLIEK